MSVRWSLRASIRVIAIAARHPTAATSRRCRIRWLILIAVAVSIVASFPGVGSSAARTDDLVVGRQLYRKFCGQCHALSAANAAGFGSNTKGGFGDLGGPSFNELRVPYAFSVTAVVEPTGGHEVLKKKITAKQLHAVAAYIARVTRNHPVPAFPTSG